MLDNEALVAPGRFIRGPREGAGGGVPGGRTAGGAGEGLRAREVEPFFF